MENSTSVATPHNTTISTAPVKRPWQGTLLAVLSIISAVLLGIGVILSLVLMVGSGAILSQANVEGASSIVALMTTLGSFIIIPFLLLLVLQIFITRGLFKGQKWSVIVLLVLSVLSVLGSIYNKEIVSILIGAFIIYAEYACLKDPFYNRSAA